MSRCRISPALPSLSFFSIKTDEVCFGTEKEVESRQKMRGSTGVKSQEERHTRTCVSDDMICQSVVRLSGRRDRVMSPFLSFLVFLCFA